MYTKFPYGTSAENDQLLLPDGMISIDIEKKAIRLHDGVTQGGFEAIGERAYTPVLPGPTELVAGDSSAGYYGEVSRNYLLSSQEVMDIMPKTLPGGGDVLSANTTVIPGVDWLKFSYLDKTLFVSKSPMIHSFNWLNFKEVGVVKGEYEILVKGFRYKLRMLKGGNADPASSLGQEWVALIQPLVNGANGWPALGAIALDGGSASERTACTTVLQEANVSSPSGHVAIADAHNPTTLQAAYNNNVSSGAQYPRGWRVVLELID